MSVVSFSVLEHDDVSNHTQSVSRIISRRLLTTASQVTGPAVLAGVADVTRSDVPGGPHGPADASSNILAVDEKLLSGMSPAGYGAAAMRRFEYAVEFFGGGGTAALAAAGGSSLPAGLRDAASRSQSVRAFDSSRSPLRWLSWSALVAACKDDAVVAASAVNSYLSAAAAGTRDEDYLATSAWRVASVIGAKYVDRVSGVVTAPGAVPTPIRTRERAVLVRWADRSVDSASWEWEKDVSSFYEGGALALSSFYAAWAPPASASIPPNASRQVAGRAVPGVPLPEGEAAFTLHDAMLNVPCTSVVPSTSTESFPEFLEEVEGVPLPGAIAARIWDKEAEEAAAAAAGAVASALEAAAAREQAIAARELAAARAAFQEQDAPVSTHQTLGSKRVQAPGGGHQILDRARDLDKGEDSKNIYIFCMWAIDFTLRSLFMRQRDLGDIMNVNQAIVSAWLNGRVRPQLRYLEKLFHWFEERSPDRVRTQLRKFSKLIGRDIPKYAAPGPDDEVTSRAEPVLTTPVTAAECVGVTDFDYAVREHEHYRNDLGETIATSRPQRGSSPPRDSDGGHTTRFPRGKGVDEKLDDDEDASKAMAVLSATRQAPVSLFLPTRRLRNAENEIESAYLSVSKLPKRADARLVPPCLQLFPPGIDSKILLSKAANDTEREILTAVLSRASSSASTPSDALSVFRADPSAPCVPPSATPCLVPPPVPSYSYNVPTSAPLNDLKEVLSSAIQDPHGAEIIVCQADKIGDASFPRVLGSVCHALLADARAKGPAHLVRPILVVLPSNEDAACAYEVAKKVALLPGALCHYTANCDDDTTTARARERLAFIRRWEWAYAGYEESMLRDALVVVTTQRDLRIDESAVAAVQWGAVLVVGDTTKDSIAVRELLKQAGASAQVQLALVQSAPSSIISAKVLQVPVEIESRVSVSVELLLTRPITENAASSKVYNDALARHWVALESLRTAASTRGALGVASFSPAVACGFHTLLDALNATNEEAPVFDSFPPSAVPIADAFSVTSSASNLHSAVEAYRIAHAATAAAKSRENETHLELNTVFYDISYSGRITLRRLVTAAAAAEDDTSMGAVDSSRPEGAASDEGAAGVASRFAVVIPVSDVESVRALRRQVSSYHKGQPEVIGARAADSLSSTRAIVEPLGDENTPALMKESASTADAMHVEKGSADVDMPSVEPPAVQDSASSSLVMPSPKMQLLSNILSASAASSVIVVVYSLASAASLRSSALIAAQPFRVVMANDIIFGTYSAGTFTDVSQVVIYESNFPLRGAALLQALPRAAKNVRISRLVTAGSIEIAFDEAAHVLAQQRLPVGASDQDAAVALVELVQAIDGLSRAGAVPSLNRVISCPNPAIWSLNHAPLQKPAPVASKTPEFLDATYSPHALLGILCDPIFASPPSRDIEIDPIVRTYSQPQIKPVWIHDVVLNPSVIAELKIAMTAEYCAFVTARDAIVSATHRLVLSIAAAAAAGELAPRLTRDAAILLVGNAGERLYGAAATASAQLAFCKQSSEAAETSAAGSAAAAAADMPSVKDGSTDLPELPKGFVRVDVDGIPVVLNRSDTSSVKKAIVSILKRDPRNFQNPQLSVSHGVRIGRPPANPQKFKNWEDAGEAINDAKRKLGLAINANYSAARPYEDNDPGALWRAGHAGELATNADLDEVDWDGKLSSLPSSMRHMRGGIGALCALEAQSDDVSAGGKPSKASLTALVASTLASEVRILAATGAARILPTTLVLLRRLLSRPGMLAPHQYEAVRGWIVLVEQLVAGAEADALLAAMPLIVSQVRAIQAVASGSTEAVADSAVDDVLTAPAALCSLCEDGGLLITCDGVCRRSFHASCISGGADELPVTDEDGQWFCTDCLTAYHPCELCGRPAHELNAFVSTASSSMTLSTARPFAPLRDDSVIRCSIVECGRFYHAACAMSHPLTSPLPPATIQAGHFASRSVSRFICPAHACASCGEAGSSHLHGAPLSSDSTLVSCVRCPRAYHVKCVASSGSASLSASHILCAGHTSRLPPTSCCAQVSSERGGAQAIWETRPLPPALIGMTPVIDVVAARSASLAAMRAGFSSSAVAAAGHAAGVSAAFGYSNMWAGISTRYFDAPGVRRATLAATGTLTERLASDESTRALEQIELQPPNLTFLISGAPLPSPKDAPRPPSGALAAAFLDYNTAAPPPVPSIIVPVGPSLSVLAALRARFVRETSLPEDRSSVSLSMGPPGSALEHILLLINHRMVSSDVSTTAAPAVHVPGIAGLVPISTLNSLGLTSLVAAQATAAATATSSSYAHDRQSQRQYLPKSFAYAETRAAPRQKTDDDGDDDAAGASSAAVVESSQMPEVADVAPSVSTHQEAPVPAEERKEEQAAATESVLAPLPGAVVCRQLPEPDVFDTSTKLPLFSPSTLAAWTALEAKFACASNPLVDSRAAIVHSLRHAKANRVARPSPGVNLSETPCGLCRRIGEDILPADATESSNIADVSVVGPFLPPFTDKGRGKSVYIHALCAALAPEVSIDSDGHFYNLGVAYKRSQGLKCKGCKSSGATIGCFVSSCTRSYHLQCTIGTGWEWEKYASRVFFCQTHRSNTAFYLSTAGQESDIKVIDAAGNVLHEGAGAKAGVIRSASDGAKEISDAQVYCICRRPDEGGESGEFFVGCSTCDEWFHPSCVGMPEEKAKANEGSMLESWRCPSCSCTAQQPLPGSKAATLNIDWESFGRAKSTAKKRRRESDGGVGIAGGNVIRLRALKSEEAAHTAGLFNDNNDPEYAEFAASYASSPRWFGIVSSSMQHD
jgi:hypothetical protein